MGKVFPKGPDWSDRATAAKTKRGGSKRITIRKMFDAEIKELTESNCVQKSSPENTP